jgi:uncharacterized protein with PQ loop repeat
MPDLSDENIGRISRDVRKQEIIFSHLVDELIDHICCDVEYEMQNGLTFLEAYRRVKQKIGPSRLKEIQEETLYAVDTKYREMKNLMKISSVAGAVLFGFSALFKIQHWPGAGMMMTLGAVILAFVFMPSALGVLWKETHSGKKIILFISAFLALFFFIFGVLFKIQHWEGAGIILLLSAIFGILFFIPALVVSLFSDQENKTKRPVYIFGSAGLIFFLAGLFLKIQHWAGATTSMFAGLILLGAIALPWYTWLTWRDERFVNSRYLFLIIGFLAIIIPGTMLNLNLQYAYEDGFYSHLEQQQVLFKSLYRNNNVLVSMFPDSVSSLKVKELHSRIMRALSQINDIQVKMIQESEGKPGAPAVAADKIKQDESGPEINYRSLSKPFHPSPVKDFLMPGSLSRQELDKVLMDNFDYMAGMELTKELKESIKLIQLSNLLPEENPDKNPVSMLSGLHTLELLKNCLLTLETNILTSAPKN